MARTKEEILAKYRPQAIAQGPVESQKLRTVAQGASFGFADEIEAAVKSLVPESMGGRDYEVIRDELRGKLTEYKTANPGEAITLEVAGAFIPSVMMSMSGVGAQAAGSNLARIAKVAAGESALTAIGSSEADMFSGHGVQDVGLGTAIGTAAGTTAEVAMGKLGKLGRAVIDYARRKMKGADTAIQKELLRLAKATGLSVDEIVQDVANGRVMADNATLTAAIKGMVTEGGEVKPTILSASEARRKATTQQANESMSRALSPDISDPNILRARAATVAELKEARSGEYDEVFARPESQTVTLEVADEMLKVLQTVPTGRKALKEIYEARSIVPLFREIDDGSIQFTRAPTLEDAEILRRNVKEQTDARYSAGEGTMGETLKEKEKSLRGVIDQTSPDLGQARANYASMKSQSKQFEKGRTALNMNADELQELVKKLNPAELEAFRAGAMANINDKSRRSGTTIENLAKEDMQIGTVLRILVPEEQAARVVGDVTRAAEATSMDKLIQPRAQSMTQALQREAQLRGGGIAMDDVVRTMGGDPLALIKLAVNMVPSGEGLSDRQMVEVAKILYSESPELVERALKDNTVFGEFLKKVDKAAATIPQAGRTAGAQQGAKVPSGPNLNLLNFFQE